MRCANCGSELELGTWDNEPAFLPCHQCMDAHHNDQCNGCEEVPDGYGYCADCDRDGCSACDQYNEGCNDTRHEMEHELEELRAEMERQCEAAYGRGLEHGRESGREAGYDDGLHAGNGDGDGEHV